MKQEEWRFFLLSLLDDGRIRSRIRIREAKKHTDQDPDPSTALYVVSGGWLIPKVIIDLEGPLC